MIYFCECLLEIHFTSQLGTDGVTKTDEFSEKFQRGGGVVSNPKIYVADFCHYKRFIRHEFRKKAQHDFPKMRGGDQRPFGTFPKIHQFWRHHPSLMAPICHHHQTGNAQMPLLAILMGLP